MANEEHLAILKQGRIAWNQWRKEHPVSPDLSQADLRGADLRGVILNNANLSNANLVKADLRGAKISGATLTDADLSEIRMFDALLVGTDLLRAKLSRARLNGSMFYDADLTGADLSQTMWLQSYFKGSYLRNSDLRLAHFVHVDFNDTDFSGASMGSTTFSDCDLRAVTGLDQVNHRGPSTIGIDTIYTSNGEISESFLRGCGVQDSLITQMHSLVGAEEGVQFYSCFISYSGKDEDFARRLHGKMRDAHLRVWFALEDVQGGKKLHEQIETAIRIFDKLLVVLSEASLRSEWVMDELRKGFKAERDTGKRKLFPLRLVSYETLQTWECRDSVSGKDLAEEVRQYFIPDFSNWKDHDSFEIAFDRLLKDLRAEERAK